MKTTKRLKSLLGGKGTNGGTVPESGAVNSRAAAPAKVCLQLNRPEARHVYVAGTFNGWKPETTPLHETGNGQWKGDLTLNPGRYEYLFVVDGQWLPDPNAKETVSNPYGGCNSVVTVVA